MTPVIAVLFLQKSLTYAAITHNSGAVPAKSVHALKFYALDDIIH